MTNSCPIHHSFRVGYQEVAAAKGLKANEWVDAVKTSLTEAKGGGKDEAAQCAGKGVANVWICSFALDVRV
jgi:hypothetical protein